MSDISAKISQSGLLKGSSSSQQEIVASKVEVNTAGINLGDLSDVVITSPADGSYVVYQSSSNTFLDDQTITKTANGINFTGDFNVTSNGKINFTAGTAYDALNLANNNIIGVNKLHFADAGFSEGIDWENIRISETNDGLTANAPGDLQIQFKQSEGVYARRLTVRDAGIDVVGTVTFDGGTTSADLNFGDSDKAVFGASGNLKIYFDGNHSYVYDTGPGDLRVRGNNLYLQNDTGGNYLSAINGGATTLFHNGNTKIATTANGLSITGRAEATEEFRSDIFRGSTYPSNSYLDFDDDETSGSSEATTLESVAAMNLKFDNNANDGQKFRIFGNTDGTNTAAFTIDNELRVGINTETPDCKFHLKDTTNVPVKIETTHSSGNARLVFKPGANDGWNIGANDNGNFTIYDIVGGQNSVVVESGADINTLFVDADSRIGIGTNNPLYKLQVAGSIYANQGSLFLDSGQKLKWGNSQQFIEATNSGPMEFGTGNAIRMVIKNDGNVGIGATNPSNQLTVRSTSAGDTSGIKWDNGTESVKAYFVNGNADSDFFITYTGTSGPEIKLKHDGDIVFNEGTTTGNVGINKNNPSTELDVTGTVTATTFSGDLNGTINTATTAATQAATDNSTKVATTAYVKTAVSDLVGGAGEALDTLNELATALGNDANFSNTITTALGNRLRVDVNNQSLNATQKTNARTNLGLGTAATTASTDYVAASSLSTFGGTLIDDADASAARTTLGLGTAATIDFDGAYNSLSGKPTLYSDSDVDTHLNQSTAANNEVLSWNGSDYDWVAQSSGIALTDISVSATEGTASGDGGISYNNSTGVFTYTPPVLLQLGTTSTTALAGDTALLQLGTSSTTALAGDTALLQLGTTSTTALAGNTALLQLGTTSTTALAGNTALLQLGTTSTTALAGNTTFAFTDITSKPTTLSGYGITDAQQLGQPIVSTSAADIELDPNAGGKVVFKGNATRGSGQFVLNCEVNTHGITLKGPPHSAGASYTLVLPNDTGSNGQVLKTDGNGNLSWVSQTAAYTDSNVDTHLNVASASSGQILSWNGSDYAWVADQTGGGGSARTVSVDTNGDGSINNTLESSETLVLKAGTNVTLAESGGVVTFNSSGGSGSSVTIKDEGTSLTTAASTIDFVGAGVTATESSGTVTVTIPASSTPQNEVSTFAWTSAYPLTTSSNSSALGTSYTTSTNSFEFGISSSTTNLRRSYTSKSVFNVSYSGSESTQVVYIRLQIKAPGASTSRITLGTANYSATLGSGYGARTKWYISGNVSKYISGSKLASTIIGGKVSKTDSNSPSSTQQWNIEAAWYNSTDDKTYFTTPYNGASQILDYNSAPITVYLDPFGYAAANTWVTFDESKEVYRMSTYNLGATMTQALPLVYSSYAMDCRLQWRKWTTSGSVFIEEVTGEVAGMSVA